MAASEAGGAALTGRLAGSGSTVSLGVAVAIVVADMVGVGVFTSLGFQVKDIPTGFSILLLWVVGGIVALCGVFSYGELGAMFPRSSGEYNFLGRAYHPAFGFVAGWVSATVGFAAPVSLAAMAFGEYGRSIEPNVPRAMLFGTLIVLVLYVALNAVFLHTAPIDKLAGQLDVARISGSHIFGELGGRIVGAMICIGLISSISAMMWIGPRVMMTMGEDIPALRVFARCSTSGAPAYAILFQLAVASLMLFTRSFEAVLEFIQFSLLFCSFFTVLGVIKLRITHPHLRRPYRAWGYPVSPLVFLLVTGFMMYYLLTDRLLQSVLGIAIMILGLLIYAVFRKQTGRGPAIASSGGE